MVRLALLSMCGILLLSGCRPPTEEPSQGTPASGSGEVVALWMGALTGVPGENANGAAEVVRFAGGLYRLNLQLNIEAAAEGFFYEAWLRNPADKSRMSAGRLKNPAGNVRHVLFFETADDVAGYTRVEVTRERENDDASPDAPVAAGTLEVRPL